MKKQLVIGMLCLLLPTLSWADQKESKTTKPTTVKAAPVKAAPVKAAPVKAAPVKAAPVKAAPAKAAPVKAAPVKAAPVKAAPTSKPVGPRVLKVSERTPLTPPKTGTRLAEILNSQVIRICVRADIPPFGYFTGLTLTGFDIQLSQALSTQLSNLYHKNLHVAWSVINAGARIASLQQKSCDLVIAAFSYTPLRSKLISFSNVYLQTEKVLISAETVSRKVPVIALVRGATIANINPKGTYQYFNNYTEIIYAMESGTVDYAISDRPIALHMIRSVSKQFRISKVLPKHEKYSIGINKQNKGLLEAVNKALDMLAKSGRLAYLHRQWL